jgi:hypothetical protein
MARTLDEIIEDRRRNMRALYESLNGDPFALELARKVGAIDDDVIEDKLPDGQPPTGDPILDALCSKLHITDSSDE